MTMDELRALAESHQSRLLSNPFLELLHTLAILSFLNLRLLIFFFFLLHVLTGILIAVRGGNSRGKTYRRNNNGFSGNLTVLPHHIHFDLIRSICRFLC
jgi:hypothetical protein